MSKIHIKCPGPQKEWSISTTSQSTTSAENENQNKDGNQRGQLELWQRAANRGVSRIRNQGPRTKERGPRNCRQGAKKQSNIHLLFNTKTQFVHSPGNHQQTSPAGILLLHTHTHTRIHANPGGLPAHTDTRADTDTHGK